MPAHASMLARVIMEAAATATPAIMAEVATILAAADGVIRTTTTRIGPTTTHIGQEILMGTILIRTMRVIPTPTRITAQDMATTQLWLHRSSVAWVSSAIITG